LNLQIKPNKETFTCMEFVVEIQDHGNRKRQSKFKLPKSSTAAYPMFPTNSLTTPLHTTKLVEYHKEYTAWPY
jgi:hypothetical protein